MCVHESLVVVVVVVVVVVSPAFFQNSGPCSKYARCTAANTKQHCSSYMFINCMCCHLILLAVAVRRSTDRAVRLCKYAFQQTHTRTECEEGGTACMEHMFIYMRVLRETDCYDRCNEFSCFMIGGKFVDQLSYYQLSHGVMCHSQCGSCTVAEVCGCGLS